MDSTERDNITRIETLENDIFEKKRELASLRLSLPKLPVDDYRFCDSAGASVTLSELFGPHDELIVIHNMGKGCAYCTLWADGFNGVLKHIENRASFVVISPDDSDTQKKFAASRGWEFSMVSGKGSPFTRDMGFELHDHKFIPGVSTFFKNNDGQIFRIANAQFGPGDDFCGVWHLFDLLPGGRDHWQPKFSY